MVSLFGTMMVLKSLRIFEFIGGVIRSPLPSSGPRKQSIFKTE